MRYIEWAVMFLVAGVGIALANFGPEKYAGYLGYADG